MEITSCGCMKYYCDMMNQGQGPKVDYEITPIQRGFTLNTRTGYTIDIIGHKGKKIRYCTGAIYCPDCGKKIEVEE